MNGAELDEIAKNLIAGKLQDGQPVRMEWAVQELIRGQGDITGKGVPFYILCAHEHVWRVVKRVVDKYDQEGTEDDGQLTLDGFDYLHVAYSVERDKERVLIPIGLIPDDELLARADEFEKQSRALIEHANELRRYVKTRSFVVK